MQKAPEGGDAGTKGTGSADLDITGTGIVPVTGPPAP